VPGHKAMRTVRVDDADGTRLLESLRAEGFVALFGSGVSGWKPSTYPLGAAVTAGVARFLTTGTTHFAATVERLIGRAAFEHVLEGCPEEDRSILCNNIVNLYDPDPKPEPNPIHKSIASLIATGTIRHAVTTNYDSAIEDACRALSGTRAAARIVAIVPPAPPITDTTPIILKIHGCAATDRRRAPGVEPTIVFHLAQEGVLCDWKRNLLAGLTSDRTLVVCGYSGLDFEICPELELLSGRIRRLVWNTQPGALTENAHQVLERLDGIRLVGDMKCVFDRLDRDHRGPHRRSEGGFDSSSCEWNKVQPDATTKIVQGLDSWTADRWRLDLFASIGCGIEGANLARAMGERLDRGEWRGCEAESQRLRYWVRHGLGRALFHQGAYIGAARWYSSASDLAAQMGWSDGLFRAQMDAAEAERVAGQWFRSWRRVNNATRPKHHGVFLRKALLLHACLQCVPGRLRRILRRIGAYPTARLTDLLRAAAAGALDVGARLDYQQAELLAAAHGIPRSALLGGKPASPTCERIPTLGISRRRSGCSSR
jgi:hypothetical protein